MKLNSELHPAIKNEDSFILFQPTMGKPDPTYPYTLDSINDRPQINAKAQRGPTCYYTALKRIRLNPGKLTACPEELKKARQLEMLFSTLRKKQNIIAEKYDDLSQSIIELKKILPISNVSTKQFCQFLLEMEGNLIHLDKKFRTELEHFIDSDENELNKYIKQKQNEEGLDALNWFFSKVKASPLDNLPGHPSLSWSEFNAFSIKKKHKLLHGAAIFYFMKTFPYLKFSHWTPEQGVKSLIQTLKNSGPCVFSGDLGQSYYKVSPKKLKDENDFPIYFWPKGSEKEECNATHMLNMIGAQIQKNRGYVYFTDPNDPSPSNDPNGQRIYCVSYDNFVQSMRTLNGLKNSYHAPLLCYSEHKKISPH